MYFSCYAQCRDSMLSPMIVMLLRLLTSAEIQRRTDFFAPFVMVTHSSPTVSAVSKPAVQACSLNRCPVP